MSKRLYEVKDGSTTTTVNSLKDVSEILGQKVTGKMVENQEVPVTVVLGGEEHNDSALQNVDSDDNIDKAEEEELVEDTTEEKVKEESNTENVKEDTTMLEKDINVNETMENEMAENQSDDVEDTVNENEEDINEEEIDEEETEQSNLDVLKAKMREINAKQAKTTKGKKCKTIEFDGNYPEIGTFEEVAQFKKFVKKLTDEQVDEWLELEGWADEVKICENEGINRMRKVLAIKNKHFPPKKSKSKYSKFSLEDLMEMAIDNEIAVKDTDDLRIQRMYVIMALRDAGVID